ncbi:glycosyltransferase family 4 protein [Microbispora hainanensis]|uniref:Glycosyltransferase family 4 protein n=1 Tax=Microbispora hainanensis TaxID=568844 RepID=A0A544YVV6_9ACTN|nr:glycosyltransferase family 4 protein [Microbispora hainanensis]TQS20899.1 glycosyltransferase family 4 protein [Microbispora hainanensis]
MAQALHIGMIAPPWYDVPPRAYGGIEAVTATLVRGLRASGHRVTVIGAGRDVDLRTYDEPPSDRIGEPFPEVVHAAEAARLLRGLEVDIVHDHSLAGPLTAAGRLVPTVVTCHSDVSGELGDYYRSLGADVALVAISSSQRAHAPGLNWVGRVHNAVDVAAWPFRERKDDWVLWLGRFNPDKGAHLAIEAARAAGRRILLVGRLAERAEWAYFRERIEPLLGPGAEYLGEADERFKSDLFSRARCLVLPLLWDEPFGMVMIEAMACGTPVVALRRGAVPEIVVDGVTGYIRDTPEELPAAIEAVSALDPHAVRDSVVRHFDVPVMIRGYERVYHEVTAASAEAPRRPLPLGH